MVSTSDAFTLLLNRDGCWRDFTRSGLELDDDGALRLAALPMLDGAAPAALESLQPLEEPAGIAVAPNGDVYLSDPKRHLVLRVDGCDRTQEPAPCIGGEGEQPNQLSEPRGLLVHATRNALLVADSGNARIQLFDLATGQLLDIWRAPGRMTRPLALADDQAGNVYVADASGRLIKFDYRGAVVAAFSDALDPALPAGVAPAGVALDPDDDELVYLLDAAGCQVFVITATGAVRSSFSVAPATAPMGLVVHSGVFEVGDNGGRRLLRFDTAGAFIGEAGGFSGPVAALAIDRAGSILIHPGDPDALVRLAPSGAYARLGSLWGGPFSNGSYRPAQRHRLRMLLDELPAAARIGLHVFRGKPGVPPPPVGSGPVPFADPGWHTIPIEPGATETLIAGEPEDEIHVGIEFRSEGRTTPTVRQIRLDFDYVTSIEDLPAIYRDKPESTDFLNRFLALFESAFEDTDTLIEELPSLVDPAATPDAFLPWLAGWLAEEVDERRSSEQQRRAITTAFARAGWRGTVEGLRAALADEVGVAVAIEEPIIQSGWWALPDENDALAAGVEQSVLGFTTALAAFEPQGAVLGASATLDAAHLIAEEQYGAPLFAEAAHRVAIRLYRGRDYSERTLAAVNAIVEREKPAHVAHHLCVVEPAMRIGFQTRIGIDSIVAAPRPADLLGVGATDPAGLRLGGEAAGRIGAGGDIGRGTRLGG